MYDLYPDRLPEPPPPRRRAPLSRTLASILFAAFRLGGAAMFLIAGLAVTVPILVFLWRSIDPDRPPRVPIAERVGHAHALAVDPADGALYVATPRGLFWVKNAEWAQRVSDSYQDSRGLIVMGPNEFLAGGRPDIRDRVSGFAPEYSGLISSDDAGHEWRNRALSGKAHFTVLDARAGAIFAYDLLSSTFMVSNDNGKTWEARSQIEEVVDFAVNPAEPAEIFLTTVNASLRSTDGGRSWQPAGERRLPHLAWPEPGSLWGVDETGAVLLSNDRGGSWEQQSNLGPPVEAFLAAPAALYAAAYDEANGVVIYKSSDGGKTWQEIYRDPALASG